MKAIVHTLGCKVNAYESEVMSDLLKQNGYEIVSNDNIKNDVCIINTCTVTNTADKKTRKIINQCIRNNPNAIIIAVGCFTQVKYNDIKENKNINIILGTNNKTRIIDCINEFKKTNKQIIDINESRKQNFENMSITSFADKHRAFVKIQDGCNNFCSFCIIPYVRGSIRCKSYDNVIDEITSLVKNGFKEVVLTGIHTGSYMDQGHDFCDLVKNIVQIDGLKRLRISSIEITELHDDFLKLLNETNIIVDHMHIPLQSGSDKILKLMNRKYDTSYFYDKIQQIRSVRPNISITTDVIAGFPGETDNDFMDMYKFIDKINFSSLHIFPYSKRSFTKAADMANQVSEEIKNDRVKKLMVLKERKEIEYMNRFVGKNVDVLIETKVDNKYIGHSGNYLKVQVESKDDLVGKISTIKIKKIDYPICIGEVISIDK